MAASDGEAGHTAARSSISPNPWKWDFSPLDQYNDELHWSLRQRLKSINQLCLYLKFRYVVHHKFLPFALIFENICPYS